MINIIKKYPKIVVYGPKETMKFGVNRIIYEKNIQLLNKKFYIFHTPGHTSGHVSYYIKPYIFCGDTLFSGGCGRVEDMQYINLYNSIKKILSFPMNSYLCCSHEYTLSNIKFALLILPNDVEIKKYYQIIKDKKCTLPSSLFIEKKINLFLRTNENKLKKSIGLDIMCSDFESFTRLRLIKNLY